MIGTRLSHYKVTAHLGTGGMGEVYRARDERLGRDVAIKLLRPELLADDAARARLRREARSLSRLNHPNICTVFDFDSDGDRTFMVVELLEGETLAQRVSRGPLPPGEVRRIGIEIASALEAAHEHGVIHRDLKPGNVMTTAKGATKVLDFGLARTERDAAPMATTDSVVSESHTSGTLPYMAPEQVRGEPADGRTDVYGLGAILYELVTGRRPFAEAQSLALAGAILYRAPDRPKAQGGTPDAGLEGIILRCLEKDPARRFQSAREVKDALAGGAGHAGPDVGALLRLATGAAAVVLLVVVAAWLFRSGCREAPAPRERTFAHALAVLPLTNLSGDSSEDYFADGVTEELITTLGQVSALRVTSHGSVAPYKKTSKTPREIGHDLGVDLLVEGALMRSGNMVRISAKIVEVAGGGLLWSGSFDRSINDGLSLQSDVANAVVQAVKVRMTPDERSRLTAPRAADPAAHEAYLRGREQEEQFTQESLLKAIGSYENAATIQPDFAPAQAGVASAYLKMSGLYLSPSEAMPRAESAALKALAIDSTSAEALAALAYVKGFYRFDWAAAESELRRAIALNPSESLARSTLGYLLTVTGRFDESRREFERTREIDPLSQVYASYSLMPLYEGRDYDEAIRQSSEILRADPKAAFVRMIRAQAYSMKGDYAAAARDLETSLETERQPHLLAYLIHVEMKAGNRSAADSAYAEFKALQRTAYIQPYTLAIVSLARGDRDAALEWLKRGVEDRNEEVAFLKVDPVLDPLRGDPRYRALLNRVGLGS